MACGGKGETTVATALDVTSGARVVCDVGSACVEVPAVACMKVECGDPMYVSLDSSCDVPELRLSSCSYTRCAE